MNGSSTNLRLPKAAARRARVRGAASVEAVIVLPVFILLLVGVLYVRDLAVTKQSVEMRARTCAWLYSSNNCTDTPPGCEGILTEVARSSTVGSDVARTLEDGRRAIENVSSGGVIGQIVGGILGPVLERAFGRSLEARVVGDAPRPELLRDEDDPAGERRLTGRYQLACNLAATTPGEVAEDAWRIFRP